MSGYLEVFARFGIPGLVIGLQYVWIWRQEKRLQRSTEAYEATIQRLSEDYRAEQAARVEDAKAYTTLALDLQRRVIDAVDTISDTLTGANTPENGSDA